MRQGGKFGNIPTVVDGIRFDSKAEALAYTGLKIMEKVGEIRDLEARKSKLRYPCVVNEIKICDYEADFRYVETKSGQTVVCDVKGFETPEFRLKEKLVLACHGIVIFKVNAK